MGTTDGDIGADLYIHKNNIGEIDSLIVNSYYFQFDKDSR
jgi:hypothetical protein